MSLIPREWVEWDAYDLRDLPPDLTGDGGHGPSCPAMSRGYCCTRREGHTGRHAAGAYSHIAAVWEKSL